MHVRYFKTVRYVNEVCACLSWGSGEWGGVIRIPTCKSINMHAVPPHPPSVPLICHEAHVSTAAQRRPGRDVGKREEHRQLVPELRSPTSLLTATVLTSTPTVSSLMADEAVSGAAATSSRGSKPILGVKVVGLWNETSSRARLHLWAKELWPPQEGGGSVCLRCEWAS